MNTELLIIDNIFRIIPKKYRLPFRYYYRKWRNTLEPEMRILNQLVDINKSSVDIGASWGLYTFLLSGLSKTVHAFEPLPFCCETINSWNKNNVIGYNVALSSIESQKSINVPVLDNVPIYEGATLNNLTTRMKNYKIQTKTLDSYALENIGFVKIDVEGHELDVLLGATNTLTKYKPNIIVEVEARHCQNNTIYNVFEELLKYNYNGYFFKNNKLIDIKHFDIERHQRPYLKTINQRFEPEYVNNFIFTTSKNI